LISTIGRSGSTCWLLIPVRWKPISGIVPAHDAGLAATGRQYLCAPDCVIRPASAAGCGGAPVSVRSTTLPNVMTVLTDDMPHLESASLGIWVKAGSRSETEAEHGISHVLEHMAFKGTRTRSALEIASAIEDVGGDLNAATSVEHTGYFARVLKEDVALAGDILSDILQNSLFEQDELDREQQVIVQEIGAARDNPDDHVFDLFQQAAYPGQPIGRTILGTVESVRSFGPRTIRDYMDRNYVGDRMVLCAAGNVDHDA